MVPEAARVAVSVDGGVVVEDSVVAAVTSLFSPPPRYSKELCLLPRLLVRASTT